MRSVTYSKAYRIIHWAIAIAMFLLLVTIFLRLTWLNKNNVAAIIGDYLNANGLSLTDDQLILLAKKIRQPMWNWHIYLGYVLVGLFGIRFLMPLFGEMKFKNPLNKELSSKEKFQYWIYILFYVCIIVSLTTGVVIELGPKVLKKPMEEIHILSIYYLVAYLFLHIGGVLLAEFTSDPGIVSKIITGIKKVK